MTRFAVAGFAALLFVDPGLSELKNFAPTVIIVLIVTWATLKIVPVRKDIRFRELEVREKEIVAQVEAAVAITGLSNLLEKIAVEQRQASEVIEVAQRVNVNSNEKLTHAVDDLARSLEVLNDRMERVEVATGAAANQSK